MGWPVSSTTDEARVKWKIAMKFLIPVKFDVNRAIELYKTHEVRREISLIESLTFPFDCLLAYTSNRKSGSYLDK